jgi:hypothetical protein
VKTILKRLKFYIEVDNFQSHRKFIFFFFLAIIYPVHVESKSYYYIDETKAIITLKNSQFPNSITKKTRLFEIYKIKSNYLFHYVSNGWQEDHPNEGLIVFIKNRFSHYYYLNHTCNFKISKKHLICHFVDFPGESETNLLSDVIAGKKIVIGGSDERPWRGSRQLYR